MAQYGRDREGNLVKYDPASSSWVRTEEDQSFGAGVDNTLRLLGSGAVSLADYVSGGALNEVGERARQDWQAEGERAQRFEGLSAGQLGQLAPYMLAGAPGAAGPGALGLAAAGEGLLGGLSNPEDPLAGTILGATGALAGGMGAALLQRSFTRATARGTTAQRALRAIDQESPFQTPSGIASGEGFLPEFARKTTEQFNPMGYARRSAMRQEMADQALDVMNQPRGTRLIPENMLAIGDDIGAQLDDVARQIDNFDTSTLGARLGQLGRDVKPISQSQMQGVLKKAYQTIDEFPDTPTGQQVMDLRSQLTAGVNKADGPSQRVMLQLRDEFDEVFEQAGPPQVVQQYKDATRAYAYWSALGQGKTPTLNAKGEFNETTLMRKLAKSLGRKARNDDLFLMASHFARNEATGADSQTAIRSLLQQGMQGLGFGAGASLL